MYKVRTLPVRFGTKKLGEDRSSQPCDRRFKATETLRKQVHPGHSLVSYKKQFCARYRGQTWLSCARFVLDGGVVVPQTRGIWRKYLKILGVIRGQQLGLTADTDFLRTPYNV